MKNKTHLILMVIVGVLLCPAFLYAQKNRTTKTSVSKSKPKKQTIKSAQQSASAKNTQSSKSVTKREEPPKSESTQDIEPTESEMKEALLRTMQRGGMEVGKDGTASKGNGMATVSVQFKEFEKLGCKLATFGAGYFCTYRVVTALEAGPISELMKLFTGSNAVSEVVTARFLKSKNGWITSKIA